MTKSKTIADVMLPMKAVNWMMGCGGVIEYPLGNPHALLSLMYSSAWVFNYCILTYLSVYYENEKITPEQNNSLSKQPQDDDDNDMTFFKILFYVNISVTFATIYMGWVRTDGMKLCIRSIEKVDGLLRKLRISEEYDKMYRKQIYFVIFTTTMITNLVTVDWMKYRSVSPSCAFGVEIVFAMRYHYPVIIQFINDFTFISTTNNLRRKFEQLNDLLKTLSGSTPLYPTYMKIMNSKIGMNRMESMKPGRMTHDDIHIMKLAKQTHLDLVKICKHVNRIYGAHLLLSMTLSSILIIALFYNAYTTYMFSHKDDKFNDIISSFNFLYFHIVKLLAVNNICDRTSQEIGKEKLGMTNESSTRYDKTLAKASSQYSHDWRKAMTEF